MARRYYRIVFGMKQHPETFRERGYPTELTGNQVYPGGYRDPDEHQMLLPGDVFEVEESLILKPHMMGGWMDSHVRDDPEGHYRAGEFILELAELVPDATKEVWVEREPPSRLEGINISAPALAALEARQAAEAAFIAPLPPVAANAPASVVKAPRPAKPAEPSPGPPPEPSFRPNF